MVSSYLYTLLADKALSSPSVLILCNKQDETMSKGMNVIEQLLEKEMWDRISLKSWKRSYFSPNNFSNLIRKTRTSQLQSVDNSQDSSVFLGRTDKDFEFSQINQKISFAESSAKNNDIEQLTNFINSL